MMLLSSSSRQIYLWTSNTSMLPKSLHGAHEIMPPHKQKRLFIPLDFSTKRLDPLGAQGLRLNVAKTIKI